VFIWDAATHAVKHRIKIGDAEASGGPAAFAGFAVAWRSDSRRFAVGSTSYAPAIVDAVEGTALVKPVLNGGASDRICWNPAHDEIISSASGDLRIYDGKTAREQ
jgi:hypothetical protein